MAGHPSRHKKQRTKSRFSAAGVGTILTLEIPYHQSFFIITYRKREHLNKLST